MSILDVETVTIKRKATGSYVNGHYVEGTETSSSIKAGVQPLTGKELLQLVEADRNRESLKVFTTSEIRINDIVIRSGKTYEVQKVNDLSVYSISHYEAVMLLIEGQS